MVLTFWRECRGLLCQWECWATWPYAPCPYFPRRLNFSIVIFLLSLWAVLDCVTTLKDVSKHDTVASGSLDANMMNAQPPHSERYKMTCQQLGDLVDKVSKHEQPQGAKPPPKILKFYGNTPIRFFCFELKWANWYHSHVCMLNMEHEPRCDLLSLA